MLLGLKESEKLVCIPNELVSFRTYDPKKPTPTVSRSKGYGAHNQIPHTSRIRNPGNPGGDELGKKWKLKIGAILSFITNMALECMGYTSLIWTEKLKLALKSRVQGVQE